MNPDMLYGKATIKDAKAIKSLLDSHENVRTPSEDEIYHTIRDYFIVEREKKLVGCLSLHFFPGDFAELGKLAVDKVHHGRGIGSRLVELSLKEAKIMGAKEVFVLTCAPDFFKKHQFKPASDLPKELKIKGNELALVNDLEKVE